MATRNGDSGPNTLNGTIAADRLNGLGGNDTLNGGGGNDTLDGGIGVDSMIGGAGNDTYIVSAQTDKIKELGAGGGTDTVLSSITFSLANYANVEHLKLQGTSAINGTGNDLHNKITGNSGKNRLSGGKGNDTLDGGGGADSLSGGDGNDSLAGGAGADTLLGGAGNDRLVWDAADAKVDGGAGAADILKVTGNGQGINLAAAADAKVKNVEIIDLTGAGSNTLTLTATDVIQLSSDAAGGAVKVNGTAADRVVAGTGWTQLGNDGGYAVYLKDGATLKVDLDIDRSGIGVSEFHLSALDGTSGFRLNGVEQDDFPTAAGGSVASAGDINGDGFDDFIVGAMYAYEGGGAAYIVFGGAGGFDPTVELSALGGTDGFGVGALSFPAAAGYSVACAGDVNGDGLADIVVGMPGASLAAVVFGATSSDPGLDLAALGDRGFTFGMYAGGDGIGTSVASAGDLNGDGYDDIVVGAPSSDNGDVYVVYGGSSFASHLDVTALDGTNGFVLEGLAMGDGTGASVSAAGDVNGDGIGDLIIGADQCGCAGPLGTGLAYVVFGGTGVASVDLGALDGDNGFLIQGIAEDDLTGTSVSAAGDVNGDGIADLIVGAPGTNSEAGSVYVIFGGQDFAAVLDLSALDGTNGFRLAGATGDYAGFSVASAGDVNGDGYGDLVIGAPGEAASALSLPGRAYVVFGSSAFGSVFDLSSVDGSNGFRLRGVEDGDAAGTSVASAGDVNGDGFSDLIIGANYAYSPTSDFAVGEAFILFGRDFNGNAGVMGTAGNDTLAGGADDVFRGGAGDDRIQVVSSGFAHVDGGNGQDTLAPGAGVSLNLGDLAGTVIVGIEGVDLSADGANTLTLDAGDILRLSGTSNTLRVTGNGDDVLDAGDGWSFEGFVDGGAYLRYTQGAAVLEVGSGLDHDLGFTFLLTGLDGANGSRLSGETANDGSGLSIAGAGDVNGDGYADFIIGAPFADGFAGASYVIFGGAGGLDADIQLASLDGTSGFRLSGPGDGRAGMSVAAAGDVNGDGFDDVIVGAPIIDSNGAESSGAAFVVFGSGDGFAPEIALADLNGTNGFLISGIADAYDEAGIAVSAAGDLNGDGYADIAVGADRAFATGGYSGVTYIAFGSADGFSPEIQLSALGGGSDGFRILGGANFIHSGAAIAPGGDINGDGIDDIVVGAYAYGAGFTNIGAAYVVFGSATGFGADLVLNTLDGTNGFAVIGEAAGDNAGGSVGAGDFNGDGIADLIVGASGAGADNRGAGYVVFGTAGGFDPSLALSDLDGTNGFRLDGAAAGDSAGASVASAGDFNGDGYDDILIGAYSVDGDAADVGGAYVVYGRDDDFPAVLDLGSLDSATGLRILGIATDDSTGFSVAAAGDVNGDGYSDILVGANGANGGAGAGFIVYGGNFSSAGILSGSPDPDDISGTAGADIVITGLGDDTLSGNGGADVFRGGQGDDVIVVSDTAFADMDGGTGNDTLRLTSGGNLNLTVIADSRTAGIEAVNLSNGVANRLTLSLGDLLSLSDSSNTLTVDGDGGIDEVDTVGLLWDSTTLEDDYQVYTKDSATLRVLASLNTSDIEVVS